MDGNNAACGSSRFRIPVLPIFLALSAASAIWIPEIFWPLARFVLQSLADVIPLVTFGILLASWISASGASNHIARALDGRMAGSLMVASVAGTLTPVCGITVLPLMSGLLAGGIPLAPVMAFWLSSPVTDPAMLAATAATLGIPFAVGKTLSAFALGFIGGMVTFLFSRRPWYHECLRRTQTIRNLNGAGCLESAEFTPVFWTRADRRRLFYSETLSTARLMLFCLVPAFAAEYALNAVLQPEALTHYVGDGRWWAVPVAVFAGAPVYLDGYAALPLARSLIQHGMSPGAAMAYLVSGSVVSIWGAMAIVPILKPKPFLLFLALALSGSLAAGWLFDLFV